MVTYIDIALVVLGSAILWPYARYAARLVRVWYKTHVVVANVVQPRTVTATVIAPTASESVACVEDKYDVMLRECNAHTVALYMSPICDIPGFVGGFNVVHAFITHYLEVKRPDKKQRIAFFEELFGRPYVECSCSDKYDFVQEQLRNKLRVNKDDANVCAEYAAEMCETCINMFNGHTITVGELVDIGYKYDDEFIFLYNAHTKRFLLTLDEWSAFANMVVVEYVPGYGNVAMLFCPKDGKFLYWSDKLLNGAALDRVSRKYATILQCPYVHISASVDWAKAQQPINMIKANPQKYHTKVMVPEYRSNESGRNKSLLGQKVKVRANRYSHLGLFREWKVLKAPAMRTTKIMSMKEWLEASTCVNVPLMDVRGDISKPMASASAVGTQAEDPSIFDRPLQNDADADLRPDPYGGIFESTKTSLFE